ncbi:MAG: four helix bundle protein [Acidobacteriota bacterium]
MQEDVPTVMAHQPPFAIRDRVFEFVSAVVRAYPRAREMDDAGRQVWRQLWNAVSSAGAHLEEAQGAGTRRHFTALVRGAQREMREGHYWMRLLTANRLAGHERIELLIGEANELVAILTAISRKASR